MHNEPILSRLTAPARFLFLLLLVLSCYLFSIFLGFLVGIPFFGTGSLEQMASMDINDPGQMTQMKYFQIVSQLGFFIFPSLLYAWFAGRQVPAYFFARVRPDWPAALLVCCLVLVSIPLISGLIDFNEQMRLPGLLKGVESWMKQSEQQAETITRGFLSVTSWGGFIMNMMMIAVIPSLGEELLFRGILIRLFREWTGNIHWAVIISSVLFSSMHLQFYGFLPRLVLGLILAYLFVWSANLWVPILAHFVNNALAVVAAFLHHRGVTTTDYDMLGVGPLWWEVLLSGTFTVLLLFVLFRRFAWVRKLSRPPA